MTSTSTHLDSNRLAAVVILLIAAFGPAWSTAGTAGSSEETPLDVDGPAAPVPWERYGDWPSDDWSGFNTVANQQASPPASGLIAVTEPISSDPAKGRELALDRKRGGSCVACHVLPDAALPGNVGPDLSTIATWGRTDEWLYNFLMPSPENLALSMFPAHQANGQPSATSSFT